MNGIVRKEQMKQERIIRSLWLKMNYVDEKSKKRLDKQLQHHVECLNKIKQMQGAT